MTQYWREKVLRVAREYPDIQFAVANEESFEEKLKQLGLHESGEDVNVGLYDEQDRKFALVDEEFSEESLTEFIDSWKAGGWYLIPLQFLKKWVQNNYRKI